MPQKTNFSPKGRRARPRPLRLPAAVAVITLALVSGRALLMPGSGAESQPQPAPTAYSPTPVLPSPPPTPAPKPVSESEQESYDYTAPVPQSDPAAEDWFADAAFIGDSLTDGLLLYSGVRGPANLSYKGLTVQSARTDKVIKSGSGKITPLEALGQKTYGKVYLLLGVNELGWYNDERFYNAYAELIDLVRETQPDAQIYLQTLLPVTAEQSADHAYINNSKIEVYNSLITTLAAEKEVFLLDTHAALAGEDGALPAEGSTDGVHLTKPYYKIWLEYLRVHTVSES